MTLKISALVVGLVIIIAFFHSCIERVDSEFDFQEDIMFIDAYALTEPGISYVTINKSVFQYNNYKLEVISNAIITLENVDTGSSIDFIEDSTGVYRCPANFAVETGEVWKMYIELENGKRIESKPQSVTAAIPIDSIKVEYAPEVKYDASFGKFIPGHRISIDWKDPSDEKNYYMWKHRTFEPLYVCKTCERGIYRNGACQPSSNSFPPYYNYLCDPSCWLIRYGTELPIFDDQFEDGTEIFDREITIIPFYRRPNILIEVQQLSLNESSYNYFKIINDQVNENGGLNAPPPAALLGNLFNPNDLSDLILGQFTTAGISTKNVFIDRSLILETPIRPDDLIIIEDCSTCPVLYPCVESAFRTQIKPEGWL